MATVKFDEGTKIETSLDLEDGEVIIFVKPPKNLIARNVGFKTWNVTAIITNKRLVTIPQPPNKKNYAVESYYFKDIASANQERAASKSQEAMWGFFSISMKSKGNSSFMEGGKFMVRMDLGLMSFLKSFKAEIDEGSVLAKQSWAIYSADMQTRENYSKAQSSGASHYVEVSPNLSKIAADAQNKDYSKFGHNQIRDYIISLVNQCVATVNA